jgi:hypothetical protein
MKLYATLCFLVLAGCATVPAAHSLAGGGGPAGATGEGLDAVRLETPAGTFLVHPNNAEDFARLLAGEPTQQQYFSVSDAP